MASELGGKATVVVGSAVVSSLGTAFGSVFNTIENRLKQLEQQGKQTTMLRNAVEEATKLEQALEQVDDQGSDAAVDLRARLDKVRANLREQQVDVSRLADAYKSLGRVMEGIDQQKKGLQSIAEGKELFGKSRTVITTMMKPVQAAATFDNKVGEVVGKAGVRGQEDREEAKRQLSGKASEISRQTGMGAADAVGLVGQLVEQGLKLDKALELAPALAKFSISQGVEQKDAVKLGTALSKADVGSAAELESVLGGYAAQAAAGDLDIAEMTRSVTTLLPQMTEKGLKGVYSAWQLGAMTQAQSAGGADAATGVDNIKGALARLTPGTAVDNDKQFKQAMGSEAARNHYSAAVDASTLGSQALDSQMAQRQADPGYQLQAASNSLDELKRSYGAILLPYVGRAAEGFATVTQAVTDLMNKCQPVVLVVSGLAAGVAALGAAAGAYRIGKGVLDVGRGLYKQSSGTAEGQGRGSIGASLLRVGLDALGLGGSRGVESGGAGSASETLAAGSKPVDVRVVNMGDLVWRPVGNAREGNAGKKTTAGSGSDQKGNAGAKKGRENASAPDSQQRTQAPRQGGTPRGKGASNRRRATRNNGGKSVKVTPKAKSDGAIYGSGLPGDVVGSSFAGARPSASSSGFRFSFSMGDMKAALKRLPGASLADGAMMALDVLRNATTPEERAEGLGAAVGTAGGSMAGGAIGAAIGQVLIPIPGVGAAIGGMVGASLGGDAGADFGAWLGRLWNGRGDKASQSAAQPAPAAPGAQQAPVLPTLDSAAASMLPPPANGAVPATATGPVQQNITLSPNIPITVQGNITNPDDLIRMLAPAIQRMFSDLAAQASRGNQLWDAPATTYAA